MPPYFLPTGRGIWYNQFADGVWQCSMHAEHFRPRGFLEAEATGVDEKEAHTRALDLWNAKLAQLRQDYEVLTDEQRLALDLAGVVTRA